MQPIYQNESSSSINKNIHIYQNVALDKLPFRVIIHKKSMNKILKLMYKCFNFEWHHFIFFQLQ